MKTLIISLKIFFYFTLLTGIIYPLFVYGMAQFLFPEKANGSLVVKDNKMIGSELIGQQFDSETYFFSRPSSVLYNPLPSGGSNYGLTNGKLKNLVQERKNLFIAINQLDSTTLIPSEMLFASASGLDPHISPEAAFLQVERIAKNRRYTAEQQKEVIKLIKNLTEEPQFHLFGQRRINVFRLNLNLDNIK
jgi:potassium-transporting ATPase KdpC subunit